MLKDRWLICLASEDWGGHPSSSQHLTKVFAKYNKVLWIDSVGMRRPQVSAKDARRVLSKLKKFWGGLKQVDASMYVYTPVVFPWHEFALCRWFNRWFLNHKIRQFRRQLNIENPVWWISTPIMASFVSGWEDGESIYYMGDEYTAFYPSYAAIIKETEALVLEKVKLTLVISEALYQAKKNISPNVVLIGHGVDVTHFAAATNPLTPIPEDMRSFSRPLCGYYGLIKEHVDLELLAYLAQARPQWSFVIIGSVLVSIDSLRQCPNLHFIGPRPYAELPAYLKAFDVGMIPHRLTDFTLNANPLKMREYLAAGKPVVSPLFPAIAPYADVIETAADQKEFLAKLEKCLTPVVQADYQTRQQKVAAESWEAVAEQISGLAATRQIKGNN